MFRPLFFVFSAILLILAARADDRQKPRGSMLLTVTKK